MINDGGSHGNGWRRAGHRHRIAAWPYLAAQPLLAGLDELPSVELIRVTPSEARGLLADNRVDAALVEVIDLQRSAQPLSVLPAGCLAFNGPTLTVRLFSRVEPRAVATVWTADTCHTPAAMAEVLWAAAYDRRLRIVPFSSRRCDLPVEAESVVVVGDCAVAEPLLGFDYQIDLGAMWRRLTGLPFALAVWATTRPANAAMLATLAQARRNGTATLGQIAQRHARAAGWPEDLARRELTKGLRYELTSDVIDGMEEFFHLAEAFGVIDSARPVVIAAT